MERRPDHTRLLAAVAALMLAAPWLCAAAAKADPGAALTAGPAPLSALPEAAPAAPAASRRARSSADAWLRLMAEYTSAQAAAPRDNADDGWFPRPIPVSLPVGRGAVTPLLILPVPVPAASPASPAPLTQCNAGGTSAGAAQASLGAAGASDLPPPYTHATTAPPDRAPPEWAADAPQPKKFVTEEPNPPHLDYVASSQQLVELFRAQAAPEPELPPVLVPDYTAGEDAAFTGAAEPEAGGVRRARHLRVRRYQLLGAPPPHAPRHQLPGAPPPHAPRTPPPPALAPSPPRLERSLMLRGELTVPRSGYTEHYTVWWDATTGASRMDLHGGATSAYRMVLADGRLQEATIGLDRSGEREVRRCLVAAPRVPEVTDRNVPAFPNMDEFTFAGYSEAEFGRVERWTRTVAGHPGELGGVRGEALTFRHEVLVARAPDNYTSTPLRYSVAVDSSVLGPDCDGYVHRYTELRDQHHDPGMLRFDIAEACEEVEQTASRHRVDPLREYTLPHRDSRHDTDFQRFKTDHRRQYVDDTEEAVRKTLMVQNSRFVDSGNRQGATFSMEVNYLGDRLDAELGVLSGVRPEPEGLPAERFPHSRDQVAAMRGTLPRAFDWRQRGAVTHVRYQDSCSSCWAFAVVGAVEGALFVRTRRLVPLSEQCLVDCAQPFGGHGCGGTWPSAAYDYVQERGLPALTHYTPYQNKVLTCQDRRVPPVTHISSHVNVTAYSVPALKVAIRRHAPTVVLVASSAKSFVSYKRGVLHDDRCPKNKAEHAVLAVGWGSRGGDSHFVLKNSWSAAWGEDGYVRVAGASNTCGVLSKPSYPRLERADVDAAAATAPTDEP